MREADNFFPLRDNKLCKDVWTVSIVDSMAYCPLLLSYVIVIKYQEL